jgi:hypothetical protein
VVLVQRQYKKRRRINNFIIKQKGMDNLQEAYLSVYGDVEEEMKPLPLEKMDRQAMKAYKKERHAIDRRDDPEANRQMQRRIAMQSPATRRNVLQNKNAGMKEEVDLFDYLLEYLVTEGYADTNDAAIAIMANMSEEWKQSITEGYKDFPTAKVMKKAGDLMGSSAGKTDSKSKKKENRGIKMMDTMMQHSSDR